MHAYFLLRGQILITLLIGQAWFNGQIVGIQQLLNYVAIFTTQARVGKMVLPSMSTINMTTLIGAVGEQRHNIRVMRVIHTQARFHTVNLDCGPILTGSDTQHLTYHHSAQPLDLLSSRHLVFFYNCIQFATELLAVSVVLDKQLKKLLSQSYAP